MGRATEMRKGGKTYMEIATELQCSTEAVRKRLLLGATAFVKMTYMVMAIMRIMHDILNVFQIPVVIRCHLHDQI